MAVIKKKKKKEKKKKGKTSQPIDRLKYAAI